jgi:hypothetical protein
LAVWEGAQLLSGHGEAIAEWYRGARSVDPGPTRIRLTCDSDHLDNKSGPAWRGSEAMRQESDSPVLAWNNDFTDGQSVRIIPRQQREEIPVPANRELLRNWFALYTTSNHEKEGRAAPADEGD